MALVASAIWFIQGVYTGNTHTHTGESLPSVNWLPKSASNVSYYRSYINTAYEFDIDEAGFREWSRWVLSEIKKPVTISRYLDFSTPRPQKPLNQTQEEAAHWLLECSDRKVTIRDGLYYRHGGGFWVAYDRKHGRAYYHCSPH
jgi:hypothetical protein